MIKRILSLAALVSVFLPTDGQVAASTLDHDPTRLAGLADPIYGPLQALKAQIKEAAGPPPIYQSIYS